MESLFSRCFTSPQSGSNNRFIPQQNSPIPSPYTPQSPIDYIQYNPQSYPQQQSTQQGECEQCHKLCIIVKPWNLIQFPVSVSGRVRNICDNKVSGHLSTNSSNHNVRLGSDGEYVSAAHRLGSQVRQTRRSDMER